MDFLAPVFKQDFKVKPKQVILIVILIFGYMVIACNIRPEHIHYLERSAQKFKSLVVGLHNNDTTSRKNQGLHSEVLSKYRKHYDLWEKANPYLTDSPAQNGTNGYFIFECRDFCCGWADQLKGTMFAYIVANLTGRTFKARYLKPDCDITDYLVPNKYDWYLDKNFTFNKNEMVDNRFFGQASLRDFMAYTNLTEKFKLE